MERSSPGRFGGTTHQTLSAGAQQGIASMRDGRFKDEGIFKAAFVQNFTGGHYDLDDGAPGAGTYPVRHYSLELTYDNGRAKRASFYIDPGSASGDVTSFWFNEYRFVRVP
jgi:hypothetical protein